MAQKHVIICGSQFFYKGAGASCTYDCHEAYGFHDLNDAHNVARDINNKQVRCGCCNLQAYALTINCGEVHTAHESGRKTARSNYTIETIIADDAVNVPKSLRAKKKKGD